MCGIIGYISTKKNPDEIVYSILETMNSKIIHRGPDDEGFYFNNTSQYQLGMAMRRLSIIDLNTGHQPIFNDDESLCIVFNGEIYNYRELKKQLISEGVAFKTQTDTEVILRLYEKHGTKAFSILDGAFGLSIYDKKANKVIIARDFFGEKPVYYMQNDDKFYWASELKSIVSIMPNKPQIDNTALNLYFQLTYIPAPFTIYKDIFKLKANQFLEFNCNDFIFKINEIVHKKPDTGTNADFSSARNKTFDLVLNSVESRSVSDVPIGTFLSGGVDSSIISWCLAKQSSTPIDTFSIGFEKKSFDETDKSRTISGLIKSHHHEFILRESDLEQTLQEVILNFDEPFADSSAMASFVVAKESSKHIKVALSGDGADEVFGGYNKYLMGIMNKRYTQIIPQKLHGVIMHPILKLTNTDQDNRGFQFRINRLIKSIDYSNESYYNIISLGFQKNELSDLFASTLNHNDALNYFKKISYSASANSILHFREIDRDISLEGDMLVKVDRTSMLASLECRSPFLNKNIWHFVNQLPDNYLVKGWNKKHLLKEAFKDCFPKNFLDKPKKGFGVPVGDWLKGSLSSELKHFTNFDLIKKQNIFNYEYISKLVENHINGKPDNTFRLWTFFCFQMWYFSIFEVI